MKSKSFTVSPARESYIPTRSPRLSTHGNFSQNSNLNLRMAPPIGSANHPTVITSANYQHSSTNHPEMNNSSPKNEDPTQITAKIARKLKCLKTLLSVYLILILTFEIAWTYFIVKFQLIADLRSYHENWDEVSV